MARFKWEPKEDITTYELARAVFAFSHVGRDPESLAHWLAQQAPEVARHFRDLHAAPETQNPADR